MVFETETISKADQDYAKSQLGLISESVVRKNEVKAFSMEEFMANRMGAGAGVQSNGDLVLLRDWSSKQISLALHSEGQDVILDEIVKRFDFDKNLDWPLMRRIGLPLWLKQDFKLKQ